MYEIYCIYDITYLHKILNSIVLFFNSPVSKAVYAICSLLYVISLSIKGISKGEGIAWGELVLSILFYLCMFGVKADVSLVSHNHKTYGEAVVKTDVPIFIAFSASLTSKFGNILSEYLMESFSVPKTNTYQFLNTLHTISNLRQEASKLGNELDGDKSLYQSLTNYFVECTFAGMDLKFVDVNTLRRNENIFEGSKFFSNIYGTQVVIDGTRKNVTCTQAYNYLSPMVEQFGVKLVQKNETDAVEHFKDDLVDSSMSVFDAVSILGQIGIDSNKLLLNMYLLPILRSAYAYNLEENSYRIAEDVLLIDNQNRTNVELAVKQSLWYKYIKPIASFMEGLLLALAPLMSFLFAFGYNGIRTAIRYTQISLFICCFKPMLVLVNVFVLTSMSEELRSISYSLTSYDGILKIFDTVDTYLLIASYLTMSVPFLLSAIVFSGGIGVSNAVASLASMQGVLSKVSAKNSPLAPNLVSNDAVLSFGSLYQASNVNGVYQTGIDTRLPTISLGESMQSSLTKANTRLMSSMEEFSKSYGENSKQINANTLSEQHILNLGNSIRNSNSYQDRQIVSVADSISKSFGMNKEQSSKLTGALGLGFGANLKLPISPSVLEDLGVSSGSNTNKLYSSINSALNDKGIGKEIIKAQARDIVDNKSSAISKVTQKEYSTNLQELARNVIQDSERVESFTSMLNTLSKEYKMDPMMISNLVAKDQGLWDELNAYNNDSTISARTNEIVQLLREYFPDKKQAYAQATLISLWENDHEKAANFMYKAFFGKDLSVRDLIDSEKQDGNNILNTNVNRGSSKY